MSFEFHINGNQTTFFILFVLRSCTFGFADYTVHKVQELPREGTNKLSKQRFSDLVETIRMIGHELSEISIV